MAHRFGAGFQSHWTGQGHRFVSLEGGMATLGALMAVAEIRGSGPSNIARAQASSSRGHGSVFPADWAQYGRSRGARCHPLAQALVAVRASESAAAAPAEAPAVAAHSAAPLATPFVATLRAASAPARLALVREHVVAAIRTLVGDGAFAVDSAAPIQSLGLSSMHVVDLTRVLGTTTGLDLSPTLVYEVVTVEGCSEFLLRELAGALAARADARASRPGGGAAAALASIGAAALVEATPFVALLLRAPRAERDALVRAEVVRAIRCVVDDEAFEVDVASPISSLGLSSMHVVDLVGALAGSTALDLSPTLVYEVVTVDGCVAHLVGVLGPVIAAYERSGSSGAGGSGSCDASSAGAASGAGGDGATAGRAPAPPLAVLGMACRFPAGADGIALFWQALLDGADGVVPPPLDRPHNGRPSGYLSAETLMRFDNAAFAISAAESKVMDPQQRLLLQVAHEALEDAGIVLSALRSEEDKKIGVFIGVSAVDYANLSMRGPGSNGPSAYSGTSWHLSITAARLAYAFDLRGPAIAMDTACSSSLVAMDCAVNAIRSGRCHRSVFMSLVYCVAVLLFCSCSFSSFSFACHSTSRYSVLP
jgi:acyl transferase domain-containing protein